MTGTLSIFVSEFVCSGGWRGPLDTSLLTEGRAMLLAVIEDFLAVPGCVITTTWDARLGDFPFQAANLRCQTVYSPDEEARQYLRLAEASDAILVIAPETDEVLMRRRMALVEQPTRWLGCEAREIARFSSKSWTLELLEELGIPAIPWQRATAFLTAPAPWNPVVLKPDDGAGSQDTRLCHDLEELRRFAAPLGPLAMVQPYLPGLAGSTALLVRNGQFQVFPPAWQLISDDGLFTYQGGELVVSSPLPESVQQQLEQAARRLVAALPGLNGYLGIDWVLEEATGVPVVLEINPRLTTSYLGYRQLCRTNLAAAMLAEELPQLKWRNGRVRFTAAGEIS